MNTRAMKGDFEHYPMNISPFEPVFSVQNKIIRKGKINRKKIAEQLKKKFRHKIFLQNFNKLLGLFTVNS